MAISGKRVYPAPMRNSDFTSVHDKSKFIMKKIFWNVAALLAILAGGCKHNAVWEKKGDQTYTFFFEDGKLTVDVITEKVIKITFMLPSAEGQSKSLSVVGPEHVKVETKAIEKEETLEIHTPSLVVSVVRKTGEVTFLDKGGRSLATEAPGGRRMVNGRHPDGLGTTTYFNFSREESLFGLGQFQDGILQYRGHKVHLIQENQVSVNPVLVSSKGYALFFDNYSPIVFSDSAYTEASPTATTATVTCAAADNLQYYFLYGPGLDTVVSNYRELTGAAPLFPKSAFGFWQSKEHYHTQTEMLETAAKLRRHHVPVDNIVQDWFYWDPHPWGSHIFDVNRYPDVKRMNDELHRKYNLNVMVSVWSKFEPGSENFARMNDRGFLYRGAGLLGPGRYFDAFNPDARRMYWEQIRRSLYDKGFDSWWLDATEPEIGDLSKPETQTMMNNYLGPGRRYVNAYSLMATDAVYAGQRAVTDRKRVFILTRSTFAGQQRNAAASWSGDINASWKVFANQITAGINLCYTGLPYWTTDIGGFFVTDYEGGASNPEYQELYTRWFQFGAFCPIFRAHGTHTPREVWNFGKAGDWAYDTQLLYGKLRYRLMPYIYATAGQVTMKNYTILRGLLFDFPDDSVAVHQPHSYMFGSAFLVSPVTEPQYHKNFMNLKNASEVISPEFLRTQQGEQGLSGTYYNGNNFTKKVVEAVDRKIDFTWGITNPHPEVNVDTFTVRWEGKLLPPESGDYTLLTFADDGVRLWIDKQLVIDDWKQHGAEFHKGKVLLEKDREYDLRLEYLEVMGGANVSLLWQRPSSVERLRREAEAFHSEKMKHKRVYLPKGTSWYDFWTGEKFTGGQWVDKETPVGILPLYVRAGSIVPLGPEIEYVSEKRADPIELRIYPGQDGTFTLYEDEGENYDYEKGKFSTIEFIWDDHKHKLLIGPRNGAFPGMLQRRSFRVVVVDKETGTGVTGSAGVLIEYSGEETRIHLGK